MKYSNVRPLKKSNEDWVESIPVDWIEKKLSLIFETIGSGTTPSTLEDDNYGVGVPWVTTGELRESRITRTQKEVPNEVFDRTSALKKFPVNSIAIAMYGATIGRLGIFGVEACTNQACCVLSNPRNGSYQFHYYCFQAAKASIIRRAIGGGQPNINQDTIRALRFPNPSREEQRQIAAYLNRETAKIDKLIAKQQKLIKLLQEKRQAVISQAVTKGLDPNVKMKDSGVEWLGEVPEHWNIRKLSSLIKMGTSISYGIVQPGEPLIEGIPFIQTTNLTTGSFSIETLQKTSPEIAINYPRSRLIGGEVILGIRASIGAAYVVPEHLRGANLSRGVARIELDTTKIQAKFLVSVLRSSNVSRYWELSKQGSTFNEVSIATVRELVIPIPPISESEQIQNFVDKNEQRFSKLEASANRAMQLLIERRQALINAAVTGKIDVRGLVSDEEVAALDADPVLETTEEDFESEVAEADYITEEE